MRNIMVSGLPKEIHRDAGGAYLEILGISSPDSHEMRVKDMPGLRSITYDGRYAEGAGGILEITEKVKGKPRREISLIGIMSAAAAMIPVSEKSQFSQSMIDGPHILEGTVSFDPSWNRTIIDRLKRRESQAPAQALAEKVAADVIEGFRLAFRQSPLAYQIHSGHFMPDDYMLPTR